MTNTKLIINILVFLTVIFIIVFLINLYYMNIIYNNVDNYDMTNSQAYTALSLTYTGLIFSIISLLLLCILNYIESVYDEETLLLNNKLLSVNSSIETLKIKDKNLEMSLPKSIRDAVNYNKIK